jgi:hypothetical protein
VRKGGYLSSAASEIDTGHCQSRTTLCHIHTLCHVEQDHANRQTWKWLGKQKGTPGKEERYPGNRTRRLPYTEERKSVLIMRMRDQWNGGTMSDI